MSKFDEVMESCRKQMKAQRIPINNDLLTAIGKSLGPSLYKRDARIVATAQKSEVDRIRKNFMIKKLGCEDGPKLDKALDKAITKIGKSNRNKLRPVFYYLLVKNLKKEAVFI